MSQTTISGDFLKDKMQDKHNEKVVIQYGCSMCGDIFLSEQLCDRHIASCMQNTLTARDPLEETSSNRPPKRLDRCTGQTDSTSLFDDDNFTSDETSDNEIECKKIKESNDSLNKYEVENTVYEATSQMLSDNEMLITLPYDQLNESTGGPLDFSNEVAIGFEQHSQELTEGQHEYKTQRYNENEDESTLIMNYDIEDFNNVDEDSTVKILNVFTAKPSQKDYEDSPDSQKKTISMDNNLGDSEDGDSENDKILTVLNTVDVNQFGAHDEGEVTVIDVLDCGEGDERDSTSEGEEQVPYKCENKVESLRKREVVNRRPMDDRTEESNKNMAFPPNSQEHSPKSQPNKTKSDKKEALKETRSTKEGLNKANVSFTKKKFRNRRLAARKPRNQTKQNIKNGFTIKYVKDKKNPQENQRAPSTENQQNTDDLQSKDELIYSYKEIKKEKKGPPEKSPEKQSKFSVYEFFDEEEEKLKAKLREDLEKEKALKRKTCRFCNKVFKDPVDVLRHKRQVHKFQRINMTKEEIEPYINQENKNECPLCFKELGQKGYHSIYLKHLMTHCDEYNFKCRVCGLQFRRKDHWVNHESRHVVRPEED